MKKILSSLLIVSSLAFAGSQLNATLAQYTSPLNTTINSTMAVYTSPLNTNTSPLTPSSWNLIGQGCRMLGNQIKNSTADLWAKGADVTAKYAKIAGASLKTGWEKTAHGLNIAKENIVKAFSKADEYGYNMIIKHPVTTLTTVAGAYGIYKVTPKVWNWICTKYQNRTMRKLEEAKKAAAAKFAELETKINELNTKIEDAKVKQAGLQEAANVLEQNANNMHAKGKEKQQAMILAHAVKGNAIIAKIAEQHAKKAKQPIQDHNYLQVMAGVIDANIQKLNVEKTKLQQAQAKLQQAQVAAK